jgi:hypothetical protein
MDDIIDGSREKILNLLYIITEESKRPELQNSLEINRAPGHINVVNWSEIIQYISYVGFSLC